MNYIMPFMLENGLYKGSFIKCDSLLDDLLLNKEYPDVVVRVLEEVVVTALLIQLLPGR